MCWYKTLAYIHQVNTKLGKDAEGGFPGVKNLRIRVAGFSGMPLMSSLDNARVTIVTKRKFSELLE